MVKVSWDWICTHRTSETQQGTWGFTLQKVNHIQLMHLHLEKEGGYYLKK